MNKNLQLAGETFSTDAAREKEKNVERTNDSL